MKHILITVAVTAAVIAALHYTGLDATLLGGNAFGVKKS